MLRSLPEYVSLLCECMQGGIPGQVGFEAPFAPASSSFLVSHLLPLRPHIVPGLRLAGSGTAPLRPLTLPLSFGKLAPPLQRPLSHLFLAFVFVGLRCPESTLSPSGRAKTEPTLPVLSVGNAPKVVSKYMPCVSVPPGVIISTVGWGVGAGSEQLTSCTASCFTASGFLLCLMATIRGCFLSLTRKFSLQSEEYRTWKALFSVS